MTSICDFSPAEDFVKWPLSLILARQKTLALNLSFLSGIYRSDGLIEYRSRLYYRGKIAILGFFWNCIMLIPTSNRCGKKKHNLSWISGLLKKKLHSSYTWLWHDSMEFWYGVSQFSYNCVCSLKKKGYIL